MGKLIISRNLINDLDSGDFELYEDTEDGTSLDSRRGKLVARASVYYEHVLLKNDLGFIELEIPDWDYEPKHLIVIDVTRRTNGTEDNQQDGGQEHGSQVQGSSGGSPSLQDSESTSQEG